MDTRRIVGIDLGTTNSVVATVQGERSVVLEEDGSALLPSAVALTPEGEVLIGQPARNQWLLYPERTALSIKRKMGSSETVQLGEQRFTPQEVSALILKALAQRASRALGEPVERAVITVPAYFSDAQRQATREAGRLAGLEVVRLLHEPTAAALAYGGEAASRTVMVYDLGGGTFDVSIVRIDGDITEVLASHGDTHLGGDDLDQLLLDLVAERFLARHGVDPRSEPRARARLVRAVEEARCRLSAAPSVVLREEALMTRGQVPCHLELAISRDELEALIRPLLMRTLDSVHRALADARLAPRQLDGVLLAGGVTRTPLVVRLLTEHVGMMPRRDLDPDLCVAEGAAVLASRLAGQDTARVLVDVSPYAFGAAYLGELNGRLYPYCFKPVIPRNTPLPASRTQDFFTLYDGQDAWSVQIFQGENPDALQNILIGHFLADGFSDQPAGNRVLCRMDLDPDGILNVTVTEAKTGQSKHVTIENAMITLEGASLEAAKQRLEALLGATYGAAAREEAGGEEAAGGEEVKGGGAAAWNRGLVEREGWKALEEEIEELEEEVHELVEELEEGVPGAHERSRGRFAAARALADRAGGLLEAMHAEDRSDALGLVAEIERAIDAEDLEALDAATAELSDLLFYVEAR